MQSTTILGVRIDNVTMAQTLALIEHWMAEPKVHQICTANPEFVMTAQDDGEFKWVLDSAELNIPDGNGLLLAAKWQKQPLTERIAGSELVWHVAEQCATNGWRLFLLGAAPGIAEAAGAILQNKYAGLAIAGTYSGSPAQAENAEIVELINASAADVLWVAYGAPNQDKWIARNRHNLTSVKVAIGVGGALDFIAGTKRRAPRWVQRIKLEWLFRLIQEPWRWRRMLALPKFVVRVIGSLSKLEGRASR